MKRYHAFGVEFKESPQGRWVKFEDVEQLEAALTEIADFGNNRHASGKYLAGMAIAALPPEDKKLDKRDYLNNPGIQVKTPPEDKI